MTLIKNILADLSAVKPGGVTRRQLYRYLARAKIKPLGVRQRPQLYPDDAALKIKAQLGIPPTLSMRQLRDLRRRSEQARARLTNRKPTPRNGNGRK